MRQGLPRAVFHNTGLYNTTGPFLSVYRYRLYQTQSPETLEIRSATRATSHERTVYARRQYSTLAASLTQRQETQRLVQELFAGIGHDNPINRQRFVDSSSRNRKSRTDCIPESLTDSEFLHQSRPRILD